MSEKKVRAALLKASRDFLTSFESIQTKYGLIQNLPILPLDAISWENKNFDPATKTVWASVYYRPNIPIARTIGPGGFDEVNGFLQIDFNAPPDSGETKLIEWREKSRLFFHGGRYFRHEGHSVIVISAGMGNSRHVENYFRQSLTVAFKSYVKRPQIT